MLITVLFAPLGGLRAEGEGKTILFLGDSLTAGYGLDPAQAYPAVLEEKIRDAGLEWQVVNAGSAAIPPQEGCAVSIGC